MDLDDPGVSAAVFYPTREEVADPFLVPVDGATLACRWLVGEPDAGTVLYFHGNGETASLCAEYLGDLFLGLGVNVCFAEYRGYGGSDGTPALVAMLGDGERILDALGLPDDRVVAFGRSLGTLYAVELAARRPGLAGLVLESGIADLMGSLLRRLRRADRPTDEAALAGAVGRSFDQRAKLARYRGPSLVLHTANDGLLDATHARRLHEWAAGPEKELGLFDHGDHNSIYPINRDEYRRRLGLFLARAGLGPPGPAIGYD